MESKKTLAIRGSVQHPNDVVVKIDSHEMGREEGEEVNDKSVSDSKHHDNRVSSSDEDVDDRKDEGDDQRRRMNYTSSFQMRASMGRTKSQHSRLIDPSPGQSVHIPLLENDHVEDESMFDDDNPGDFHNNKINAITIVQWISLLLITVSLISTLRFPRWRKRYFKGLFMWQWETLILSFISGRLVSGWCVRIAIFFIEQNFLLRKRILYFVYGIRTPVQNCIWLSWVLIAWNVVILDAGVEALHIPLLEVINKVLGCMLVVISLWLIKTLIVKVLASSFHVTKFFDRIQDALFNQYVIEILSGPPLPEINKNEPGEKSMLGTRTYWFKGKNQNKGITMDHLQRLNPANVSAWNMKRLMRIVRRGSLKTLDERLQGTKHDEPGTEIRTEFEAKRAARNIFVNVTRRQSRFIYLDDLMRFLREDEAIRIMSLLVASPEDERVGKTTLNNWVISVFRERKSLALTLNDTKTAVNKLHRMVNVLVAFVSFFICLVILNIATTQVFVLISSQIVVVTFIFGNTCKTIFECIIFLFVIHPFDVGDRCEIDGVQMIVEEMNILNTIFLRADKQKIYYPNSTLATRSIVNFYRSPDMMDTINFLIHVGTPADRISQIKQRILTYVESNKDHWYPSPIVITMDMYDLVTQKLSVWLQHKINQQNIIERLTRRGKIIEEMVRIFKELDLEYRSYPLDINIRDMPMNVTPTRIPSTWESS